MLAATRLPTRLAVALVSLPTCAKSASLRDNPRGSRRKAPGDAAELRPCERIVKRKAGSRSAARSVAAACICNVGNKAADRIGSKPGALQQAWRFGFTFGAAHSPRSSLVASASASLQPSDRSIEDRSDVSLLWLLPVPLPVPTQPSPSESTAKHTAATTTSVRPDEAPRTPGERRFSRCVGVVLGSCCGFPSASSASAVSAAAASASARAFATATWMRLARPLGVEANGEDAEDRLASATSANGATTRRPSRFSVVCAPTATAHAALELCASLRAGTMAASAGGIRPGLGTFAFSGFFGSRLRSLFCAFSSCGGASEARGLLRDSLSAGLGLALLGSSFMCKLGALADVPSETANCTACSPAAVAASIAASFIHQKRTMSHVLACSTMR
mmetsp:Transcript_108368/g.305584  ORF Transcript_108368/g.305584 Transcript_108368/m.305584 type:complete len:390 (-) Transcript_108368:1497-2666(-)